MKRKLIPIMTLCIGVITLAIVSTADYEDEILERQHYCEMVAKWNKNKHLPPEQRPGWPPYDGECDDKD